MGSIPIVAKEFLDAIRRAETAPDYPSLREACLAFTPMTSLPQARSEKLHDKGVVDDLKKAYGDAAKDFLKVRAECLYTEEELSRSFLQMSRIHRTLGLLLSAFHERYFGKKKALGILDFSDTKQMATRLSIPMVMRSWSIVMLKQRMIMCARRCVIPS